MFIRVVRQQDDDPVGRNFALARVAALLNEDDFDEAPCLLVVYKQQKRIWGIARTPDSCKAQSVCRWPTRQS